MARLLPDWLNGYLEFTKDTEPPLSYHIWTGLSIISGALERRCVFPWGHSNIYPNQYIVLVGPSGQSRKGEAISIGKQFYSAGDIRFLEGSATKESIIRAMSTNPSSFLNEQGFVKYQCPLSIISPELIVFLRSKDTELMGWLTDWYDSADSGWSYQTKNMGSDVVVGLCVNFLGGTAPDWLPAMIPQEAVGGGWTSRCIFVVEEYKGKTVVDPEAVPPDEPLREKLENDLQEIKLIARKFRFTPEAKAEYGAWYADSDRETKLGRPPIIDPNFRGYCSRRATHIKKVGMALSASRGDDGLVDLTDFRRARALLEAAERKMPLAFGGLGQSEFATVTKTIIDFLRIHKEVRRSKLLQAIYRDVDSWTLERIQRCLEEMKLIEVQTLVEERDLLYIYKGD